MTGKQSINKNKVSLTEAPDRY